MPHFRHYISAFGCVMHLGCISHNLGSSLGAKGREEVQVHLGTLIKIMHVGYL